MHQAEEFNLLPRPRKNSSLLCLYIGEVIDHVDMRAEVGFLTRNILIQEEMLDSRYGQYQHQFFSFDAFGGHIKILRNFSSVHMSGVELKSMGQKILGSYPVHFHLAEDVDERGGYGHPMHLNNLAITTASRGGTHGLLGCQHFLDCKSKQQLNRESSGWCSGCWCLFHWVLTRQSEGKYPEGQAGPTSWECFTAEPTPVSRSCPHQDADPEKPRVPAMTDGLIAPKNNDLRAWDGDIIL